MQILAVVNNPYNPQADRSFNTVPAAMRFMLRSYFEKAGVARHVAIYNGPNPIVQIDFNSNEQVVLTKGTIEGWEVGQALELDAAIALTRKYHRED